MALKDNVPRRRTHAVLFGLGDQTWSERYSARIPIEPAPLKDGLIELLAYLMLHRIPCAVVTSTRTDVAMRELQNAGLLQHFQFVIGGEQVRRGKPDPEPYLRAVEVLRLSPAACVALEDSDIGVRSAVAAGLRVSQVNGLVQPSADFLAPDHKLFDSLRDVHMHFAVTGECVKRADYTVNDVVPDVRDGLTRKERAVLYCLRETQQELKDRNVPTIMLYGRVVEKVDLSQREFQEILTRMAGKI